MFSRRRTKVGFTLVELLIVIGVSAIVLGALGTLYAYTASQLGDATAELAATDQATSAFGDVEASIRNAVLCETKTLNGITALRCKMPAVEVDLNGDGIADSYAPNSLDKNGLEKYGLGKRVWYYPSDSTGTFGAVGTTLWRAVVADDKNPVAANLDLAWTFLYGRVASPRFPLVSAFSVTVDAANRLVTVNLTAESADYAERRPAATDSVARRRDLRILSQVCWRNWRT